MQYTPIPVSRLTIHKCSRLYPRWAYALSLISQRSFRHSSGSFDQDSTSISTPVSSPHEEVMLPESNTKEKQENLKNRTSSIQLNIPVMNLEDWNSLEWNIFDGNGGFGLVPDLSEPTSSSKRPKIHFKESSTGASKKSFKHNREPAGKSIIRILGKFRSDLAELAKNRKSPAHHLPSKHLSNTFGACLNAISLDSPLFGSTDFDLITMLKRRSVVIYGKKVSKELDPVVAERIASISNTKELQPVSIFHQSGSSDFHWCFESEPSIVGSSDNSSSPLFSSNLTPISPPRLPEKFCTCLPEKCPHIIIFLARPSARKAYIDQFNSLPGNVSDQTYAGFDYLAYERFLLNLRPP